MKISSFIKHTLILGIIGSLGFILYSIPKVIARGAFFEEIFPIFVSTILLISPYLLLLKRLKDLNNGLSTLINLLITSIIVTFPALIIIFSLMFVYPDAQNGIAIFGIVFLQWFLCLVSFAIEQLMGRKMQ